MFTVAIDGPSGAGKSTIARKAAEKLGFIYVDTGALYRAVGLFCVRKGIDTKNHSEVGCVMDEIDVTLAIDGKKGQRVILCGEDVSDIIRTPEISMAASNVSAVPKVREGLLSLQRDMAETNRVIMDGRDIGTVIFPNADIKIFLTASVEDRARRRHEELLGKGQQSDYGQVLSDMIQRDKNDSTRDAAPLKPSDDAIVVDTTGNELEKSVSIILEIIEAKI